MFLSINYGGNKVLFAAEENKEDTYSVSGILETMTRATITRKATLFVSTVNYSCLHPHSLTFHHGKPDFPYWRF